MKLFRYLNYHDELLTTFIVLLIPLLYTLTSIGALVKYGSDPSVWMY